MSVEEYERLTKKTGLHMVVLEKARCLREAFAARYGVLVVDLVRAAREEIEALGGVHHRDALVQDCHHAGLDPF